MTISWKPTPDEHDYPAALDYLQLIRTPQIAAQYVEALKDAEVIQKKAKDIIRASGLPLLPVTDGHVARNLEKIKKGHPMAPILLVQSSNLIVADGFHRVCAVYHYDYDSEVPCKLI